MGRIALILGLLAVGYTLLQRHLTSPPPPPQGFCKPKFAALESIYRKNYENGIEQGSAFAVYHKGELVCDLFGGWADPTNDIPWTEDTLAIVFSSTKGVSAIAMALLCDRGYCDYDTLVSEYWPEFAQNGKEDVTLGMLLSHQAGLAALDETISHEMINEKPDEVGRIIAAQKPNWPPGTAQGYHAISFGVIVDQLIRRIDPKHRSLDDFFREEIAEPYDIDFHIGLPRPLQWRAARFTETSFPMTLYHALQDAPSFNLLMNFVVHKDPLISRALTNPEFDVNNLNHPRVRATPQGSFNGYGTAEALARLYSITTAAKYHEEDPLLSENAVKLLHTSLHNGTNVILGVDLKFGPGVMTEQFGKKGHTMISHPGKGCQMAMGSSGLELSWAYINSYPCGYLNSLIDPRVQPLFEALLKAVDA